MRIGEIAQKVEVSTSIIRNYEAQGLLPRAGRDSLGYREYGQSDLERIRLVAGAREMGISLADIKEILAIHDQGKIPSPRLLEVLREKAADVDQRTRRLASVKRELCRLRDLALKLERFDPPQTGSDFQEVLG